MHSASYNTASQEAHCSKCSRSPLPTPIHACGFKQTAQSIHVIRDSALPTHRRLGDPKGMPKTELSRAYIYGGNEPQVRCAEDHVLVSTESECFDALVRSGTPALVTHGGFSILHVVQRLTQKMISALRVILQRPTNSAAMLTGLMSCIHHALEDDTNAKKGCSKSHHPNRSEQKSQLRDLCNIPYGYPSPALPWIPRFAANSLLERSKPGSLRQCDAFGPDRALCNLYELLERRHGLFLEKGTVLLGALRQWHRDLIG